eukprot:3840600-Prymnesium_polylepis.1
MPRPLRALPREQCGQHPADTCSHACGTCARAHNMLETWRVSPHPEEAKNMRSARGSGRDRDGMRARQGCA